MPKDTRADSIKVALFTDTHLGFTVPSSRPCVAHKNYLILEECLCLAHKLGADVILHAGDLFNQSRISSRWALQCIGMLFSYNITSWNGSVADRPRTGRDASLKSEEECNTEDCHSYDNGRTIPLALIYGNHDNADQVLNLLEVSRVASLLRHKVEAGGRVVLFPLHTTIGGVELVLYGLDYCKAYTGNMKPKVTFADVTSGESIPSSEMQYDSDCDADVSSSSSSRATRYTVLIIHQDYSEQPGREKFDLSFVDDWNTQHKPEHKIDFVYNGHEHDELLPQAYRTFTLLMPGTPHHQSRKGSLKNQCAEDRNFYLLALPVERKSFAGPPLSFCHLDRYALLSGNLYHNDTANINLVLSDYRLQSAVSVLIDAKENCSTEYSYDDMASFILDAIHKELQQVQTCAATLLSKRILGCLVPFYEYCMEKHRSGQTVTQIVEDCASLNVTPDPHDPPYSPHSLVAYIRHYTKIATAMHESRASTIDQWRVLNPALFKSLLSTFIKTLIQAEASSTEKYKAENNTYLATNQSVTPVSLTEAIRAYGISEDSVRYCIATTNMLYTGPDVPLPSIYAKYSFTVLFKPHNDPSLKLKTIEYQELKSVCDNFAENYGDMINISTIQDKYAHMYVNSRTYIESIDYNQRMLTDGPQGSGSEQNQANLESHGNNSCISTILTTLQAYYDELVCQNKERYLLGEQKVDIYGLSSTESDCANEPSRKQDTASIDIVYTDIVPGQSNSTGTNSSTPYALDTTSNTIAMLHLVPELLSCLASEDGSGSRESGAGKDASFVKKAQAIRSDCISVLTHELTAECSTLLEPLLETRGGRQLSTILNIQDKVETEYIKDLLRHLGEEV